LLNYLNLAQQWLQDKRGGWGQRYIHYTGLARFIRLLLKLETAIELETAMLLAPDLF